ncbi:aspartate aminotransferase family protein [Novosphingobium sp. G106]|uniref:aspartate aminotransferase family protein n=1 Tax=Novosphingobium sp. G106 TaxID=2849500 RepID=UPI001C2CE82F|nr:aspartate aminotransferase family protein [Novosphingobium sp. G106]MBV1689855.1 aspartate aminotransferase family protein [Novosphingobium sp. G106]
MSITPLMPVYGRCEFRPVRGDHCHLIGEDGRRYLDFAAGIAVNALGHSHAGLIGAIQRQAGELMHVSNLYGSPQGERLAQRLVDLTFADTVFFTNSGAEAVECAIKTARSYHQHGGNEHKFELITFNQAFHGRTLATISASSQEKMHKGFLPLMPGFKYVEFDDLDAVKAAIGPNTAGFLVEPIQGEGGIRTASDTFMKGLRALADEHDLMLVLDEVQCGYGRSGTFFAYEQYGITPDIVASAKGIGGGFPLGACLATEKAARGMVVGAHGSTYGGNPLAMAAGEAVLDAFTAEEVLANVRDKSAKIVGRLEQFIGNYPELFEEVRGRGLLLGIKLKVEPRGFVAHLRDNHQLLTVSGGDNTLRVVPPLVIDDSHIDEFMDKLSAGAASYPMEPAGK